MISFAGREGVTSRWIGNDKKKTSKHKSDIVLEATQNIFINFRVYSGKYISKSSSFVQGDRLPYKSAYKVLTTNGNGQLKQDFQDVIWD
jgi:hypothetical protein